MHKRVIIVTGSRKGIGRNLAESFLQEGYIVCGCSRSDSDLEHPDYRHWSLDVSQENSVKRMISDIKKEFGRIDVLINNAGIASMNHILLTPVKTLDTLFNTNLKGVFLFSREVAKVMMKKNFGRIINFSTVAVPLKLEGEALYAASKSAVVTLTEIMAKELGQKGITVNAVGPTPVQTDLIKAVPKNKIDELLQRQCIRRLGEFEDVKNVIDFFIRDESDFVTAQTVYLGGISA
jgi:3-oxoacyl-[acyl-carrier protein] reductase